MVRASSKKASSRGDKGEVRSADRGQYQIINNGHVMGKGESIDRMAGHVFSFQSQHLGNPRLSLRHPLSDPARFIFPTQLGQKYAYQDRCQSIPLAFCLALIVQPGKPLIQAPYIQYFPCVRLHGDLPRVLDLCVTQKHNRERSLFYPTLSYFEKALC
jgi:hypothetical protein